MKNQMIIKISIIMKLWTAGWTINLFKIILATRSSCKNGEMRVRLLILPLPMDSLEFDSSIRKIFFSKLKIIPYIRKRRNRETGFNPIFSNSMSGHELAHPPVASTLQAPNLSGSSFPICRCPKFVWCIVSKLSKPWIWPGRDFELAKTSNLTNGFEFVKALKLSGASFWVCRSPEFSSLTSKCWFKQIWIASQTKWGKFKPSWLNWIIQADSSEYWSVRTSQLRRSQFKFSSHQFKPITI